jgi:hypothetical protein
MPSADLVETLTELDGRPWAELGKNRKPLTQNRLARMLRPLGIAPEQVKFGPEDSRKGYRLDHFEEAFARYLPGEGDTQPINRNLRDEMGTSDISQPKPTAPEVSVGERKKSNNDGPGFGTSVAKGEGRGDGPTARANGGGNPGLSRWRIAELAQWAIGQAAAQSRDNAGRVDRQVIEAGLREVLQEEALPGFVEVALRQVMAEVFRV